MESTRLEVSAYFAKPERWAQHLRRLKDPDCTVEHLRLFHQEPHHVAAILDALTSSSSSGNSSPHSLTSLDVQGLDRDGAAQLGAFLARPCATLGGGLRLLRLPELTDADAAAHIADGLAANSSVEELEVSGLTAAGLRNLARALAGRRHGAVLRRLHLERCHLGSEEAAAELGAALAAAGVQSLQLARNEVNDAHLAALLRGGGDRLAGQLDELLDLEHNAITVVGAQSLSHLVSTGALQHLRLSHNPLRDAAAAVLAAGVAASPALRTLALARTSLTQPGFLALAAALAAPSCRLEHLDLSDNAAGPQGFSVLLRSLHAGSAMRTLRVEGCSAACAVAEEESGAAPLCIAAPRLEALWLARNRLGDAGVAVLRDALATGGGTALLHLDLCENCIGDAGISASVIPLLQQQPQLVTLLLDGNRLHDIAARRLAAAAVAHPGLAKFRAENKRVTDPHARSALLEAAQVLAGREYRAQRRAAGGSASSDSSSVSPPPLPERHSGRRARAPVSITATGPEVTAWVPPPPRQDLAGRSPMVSGLMVLGPAAAARTAPPPADAATPLLEARMQLLSTAGLVGQGGDLSGSSAAVSAAVASGRSVPPSPAPLAGRSVLPSPATLPRVSSNKSLRRSGAAAEEGTAAASPAWGHGDGSDDSSTSCCGAHGRAAVAAAAGLAAGQPPLPHHGGDSPASLLTSPDMGSWNRGPGSAPPSGKRRRFKPLTAEQQSAFEDF